MSFTVKKKSLGGKQNCKNLKKKNSNSSSLTMVAPVVKENAQVCSNKK